MSNSLGKILKSFFGQRKETNDTNTYIIQYLRYISTKLVIQESRVTSEHDEDEIRIHSIKTFFAI